ncbi:MAG: DUF1345 domain-containing protein, partial [Asticcacaulis sp.]
LATGILVFMLCAQFTGLRVASSALIGWNVCTLLYLGMAIETMFNASRERMRERALLHDDGEGTILLLSVAAAILSFVAIVFELATTKDATGVLRFMHVGLSGLTLLTSWAFIHTAFAFHYAHGYYAHVGCDRGEPNLIFPGTDQPHYTDFLYFAFVIGTSGQTADVSFANTAIRRVGLVHCVLSYLFNATVLALMINIAASLL